MKNSLILAVVFVCLAPMQGFSEVQSAPRTINVSGSAEVKVVPDEIFLRVGIETRDENLQIAARQNDESIAKALAFLKTQNMDSKYVKTDYISIVPNYSDNIRDLHVKPTFYCARKSMEIKITQIDAFEKIMTGLLTNGVNTVEGINFRTSKFRQHRDEARAMAIRAAREKADAMALELGIKRGKVYNINVNDSVGYWGGRGFQNNNSFQNVAQNAGAEFESGSETFSVGQISVSASVNVTFFIE